MKKKSYAVRFAPVFAGAFLFFFAAFPPLGGRAAKAEAVAEASVGFSEKLPRGVTVDGVHVGGMNKKNAAKLLRKMLAERVPMLTVKTPNGRYTFSYPEIGFSDNLEEILSSAEKKGVYRSKVGYFLKGADVQTEYICANNESAALDAEVRFSSEGFVYEKERSGVFCDRKRLKRDIEASLSAGGERGADGALRFKEVTLSTGEISPKRTEAAAKKDTKKISSFTTYFNAEDRGRSENIALAASKINGTTVGAKEEFSFNASVGARTKENGFKEAKIIQDGEFIAGVGGGVCQVSTTLYNAAVLAGLKITVRKSHSLAVHYVDPSRDAMVSSFSDFRFKNPHSYPVYLSAKVKGDALTVTFYGRDEGYRYEIISVKTGEIPPPDPIEKVSAEECVIREGKAGIKSEAYLETYRYGKLIGREKLRTDAYAPIRGIVGVKKSDVSKDAS